MFNSVIYFGRKNCEYSLRIKNFLIKNSKKFQYFESQNTNTKFQSSEIKLSSYEYIFCFRSFKILNKKILQKCLKAPINFHPGTPAYRGVGCVNFALYDKVKYFGSTAHIMKEKIDYGNILNVKRFRVTKKENLDSCLKKTHHIMFVQAMFVIKELLKNDKNILKLISVSLKEKWSKKIKNRSDLDALYKIDPKISKKDFLKLSNATITKNFKPYILIHSKKFYLKD